MKTLKFLSLLIAGSLITSVASADLIPLGETDSTGNPGAEAVEACDTFGDEYCGLLFDFKYNFPDGGAGGSGTGAVSGGDYLVEGYTGEPASSLVSWDLADPAGHGVFAIAVKTGSFINWYGVTDDMRVTADDLQVFTHASEGKNSISHISFFIKEFQTHEIPEPTILALLGLGLVGIAARRRKV